MKIAVFGDSHVAALKTGWDMIAANHIDMEVVFFANRRDSMKDLKRDGPILFAGEESLAAAFRFTSGGNDRMDMRDFDCVLIYGMKSRPFFADTRRTFSRQAMATAIYDTAHGTLARDVLALVCADQVTRVCVGHNPLPTARANAKDPAEPFLYEQGRAIINRDFYHPLGAELVAQPFETMSGAFYTHPNFRSGATRLAVGDELDNLIQPPNDPYHHMNRDYGAHWLRGLFKHLMENPGPD